MKGKMWVNRFIEPGCMRYQEEDIPQIADNEILVRVKACGICGSDLVFYTGTAPLDTADGKGPLILGHEFSGVVVELGAIAEKMGLLHPGDRVAINPVQQCNACPACMRGEFNQCANVEVVGTSVDGAMAQYVKVKYTHVYKIPDSVSFEEAALAEPLACAMHGVEKLDIGLGQTVVIYGTGGIGLMMTQLAHIAGAGRVIVVGRKDFGLQKAMECGADAVVNNTDQSSPYYSADVAQRIRALNSGNLADRAILATGNMFALQDALRITAKCAIVVYFGQVSPEDVLQVPVMDCLKDEKTLKFSWQAPLVWDSTFKLLGSGRAKLDAVITHRFSLKDAEKGIRHMIETREPKIKGVINVD